MTLQGGNHGVLNAFNISQQQLDFSNALKAIAKGKINSVKVQSDLVKASATYYNFICTGFDKAETEQLIDAFTPNFGKQGIMVNVYTFEEFLIQIEPQRLPRKAWLGALREVYNSTKEHSDAMPWIG